MLSTLRTHSRNPAKALHLLAVLKTVHWHFQHPLLHLTQEAQDHLLSCSLPLEQWSRFWDLLERAVSLRGELPLQGYHLLTQILLQGEQQGAAAVLHMLARRVGWSCEEVWQRFALGHEVRFFPCLP